MTAKLRDILSLDFFDNYVEGDIFRALPTLHHKFLGLSFNLESKLNVKSHKFLKNACVGSSVSISVLTILLQMIQIWVTMSQGNIVEGIVTILLLTYTTKFLLAYLYMFAKHNGVTPIQLRIDALERLDKFMVNYGNKNMSRSVGKYQLLSGFLTFVVGSYFIVVLFSCVGCYTYTSISQANIEPSNGSLEFQMNGNLIRYYEPSFLDKSQTWGLAVGVAINILFTAQLIMVAHCTEDWMLNIYMGSCQLNVLADLFSVVDEVEDEGSQEDRLKFCIKFHQQAIQYIKHTQSILRGYIFRLFVAFFIVICSALALIVVKQQGFFFKAIVILTAIGGFTNLTLHCVIGETIVIASDRLVKMLYLNTTWYFFTPKNKRLVIIMMQNMQKSVVYSALGSSTNLNIQSLVSIVKTSYTVFTILISVME